MTSPFANTIKAYECLFLDELLLNDTPCIGSVFPLEDVDPFVDVDDESTIRRISILIMKKELEDRPVKGDVVSYEGDDFKISDVKQEQDWYRITARSVK